MNHPRVRGHLCALEQRRQLKMQFEPKRFRNMDIYLPEAHRLEIRRARLELILAGRQQWKHEPSILVRGGRSPLAATLFSEVNNHAPEDSPRLVQHRAGHSAG